MEENLVFLVIFDSCDIIYDWSISQWPPIVLDNLFGGDELMQYTRSCEVPQKCLDRSV